MFRGSRGLMQKQNGADSKCTPCLTLTTLTSKISNQPSPFSTERDGGPGTSSLRLSHTTCFRLPSVPLLTTEFPSRRPNGSIMRILTEHVIQRNQWHIQTATAIQGAYHHYKHRPGYSRWSLNNRHRLFKHALMDLTILRGSLRVLSKRHFVVIVRQQDQSD